MFDTSNYFELLGIKQDFLIDQELLYQNYLKLQHILHPDKLSTKSQAEKIISMEYTAKLNKAYNILNDDKKRAEYLLSLHGVIINVEENNNVQPDSLMLNEILELSEEHQNPEDIHSMQQECWNIFRSNYSKGDFKAAAQGMIKLQYLNKLLSNS